MSKTKTAAPCNFLHTVAHNVVTSPSATKLGIEARGKVVVCASHGGLYAAWLALNDQVRAIILNDAGVGMNEAGIKGLELAQQCGVAAATVAHDSCRIGDAAHMYCDGIISFSNAEATKLGVVSGLTCADAAQRLTEALPSTMTPAPLQESRYVDQSNGLRSIVEIDSASLVKPQDADHIVICGSHGGLVGGQSYMAIQADVFAAAYNDAGVGFDRAGVTRLAALDDRHIAGVTVAHTSAQIGNARSMLFSGTVSHFNSRAEELGIKVDEKLADVIARWRRL